MQNPIPKFTQKYIISEKLGYLPEKRKTLTISNYHGVEYFLLKLCTRFLQNNVYKMVFTVVFILLRS